MQDSVLPLVPASYSFRIISSLQIRLLKYKGSSCFMPHSQQDYPHPGFTSDPCVAYLCSNMQAMNYRF